MYFDPTPKTLRSQKEMDEYLVRYDVRLPSNVKVEWCSSDTDYTEAPEAGCVCLHSQVLALGLKFPLTDFVCDLLRYYHMAPSQLVVGGCHVVLSFQALCKRFVPDASWVEDFFALILIRRTKEGRCFFTARSSFDKLIINLANSDNGWRDTVIRIYGNWETVLKKDCGAVPTAWNKGTLMHKEIPVTAKVEESVRSLL